ncbi:protein OS-9 isoform X1 [Lethenteron reissneri]|uniref:protein OS-9 isoform X1 n=1 Tax=Lethenteron reissneri TaxID=7753 RepID=UPI002AB7A70F|nr:protein OS-9 isoform X1 [Lethenteron reissneri]
MPACPPLAMVACTNLVFFLIFIALHPCLASLGVLNIDELNEMKYGIEILADPVVKGQSRPAETLLVSSKYGQQYECQLPPQAVFRSTGDSSGGEHGSLYQGLAIPELLKPMANVPCLLKTRDWWTYEFCYGKDIKQYHMEGSEIKGDIMHLGFYDSEFDWSNETAKAGKRHRLKRYHSQLYRNGTQCDLNGRHREAEVRFVCEEGGSGDYLLRVDEPQSCMYVLTVHTVRLCAHPDMRIPTRSNPQLIRCQPSLTPKEYEEYFRTRVSATQKKVDRMAQELRSLDHLLGQEEENAHEEEKDASTFSDSRGSPQQEVEEGAAVPGGEADAGGADGDQHEAVEEEQTKGETNALKDGSSPHQEVEIVTLRSVQDALKRTFGEDVLEQPGDADQQMQFKIIRNQGDLMKFLEEMQEKKKKKAAKGDRESKPAAPSSSSSDDKMDVSREGLTENSARDTGSDNVAENDIPSTPSRDGKTEAKGSEEERGEEEEEVEEEEEDDDDVEVLREFVQELRGMNLHSSDIQNVKQQLQQNIEGEFDSILEEAEAELEAEGLKGEFDKEEATKSLAGTLNRLMEKLDGTGDSGPGQDGARERRHSGGTQHVGAAADTVSGTPASTATNPAKKDGDEELMDVGRVRVRVRRLRSAGSAQGGESATRAGGHSGDQVRKIENVVKEQLEKAGMRAEGKIDVKVVSSGALGGDDDDDGAWLSDEDTRSFRDMLLGFLTGDSDEMYREQQRQQQLEDNYRFVLGGDSASGEDAGTQGQPVLADGDDA